MSNATKTPAKATKTPKAPKAKNVLVLKDPTPRENAKRPTAAEISDALAIKAAKLRIEEKVSFIGIERRLKLRIMNGATGLRAYYRGSKLLKAAKK